jgi:hypothetical protein
MRLWPRLWRSTRPGSIPQAIAQFRKALGIDPANAEALKHLDYAQNLAQDDTLSDRFTRLE